MPALLGLCFIFSLLLCSSQTIAAVTFIDIDEYRVEGNTLLDEELIQRRLERFLGPARTIEDVEAAVEVLTQEYRNAGYPAVFVEIPPQTVVGGRFILAVNETRLRRVRVTDASYFLPSGIRKAIPSLERGRSINLPALQEEIQQINTANPNLKVVPILKQGPTPELIDVELSIADELPVTGGIEINNYNSSNTTDTRLIAELGYTNLWQKHHNISMTAQTSPEDTEEVRVLSGTYVMPLDTDGGKLAFYAVKSDSKTATVGDIKVVGKGFILGGRWIHPLFQKPGNIQTLIVGVDYKDFDERINTGGGTVTKPLDYMILTAQFSQYQRTENWYDSLSLALTVGARGLFNDNDEFGTKTSRAEPSFVVLKGEYERNYPFADDWLFTHKLDLQLADTLLVSNEQMSAGGVNSVRGYYESQISGDYGGITGIQVSTPNLAPTTDWLNDSRALAYLEGAYLAKKDSGIDEDDSVGISSIGLGWRATILKQFELKLDSAYPLEHEGSDIDQGDIRTNVSVRYEF